MKNGSLTKSMGKFWFRQYPIRVAYAITIHKSQGSGYKSILVFIPEQAGHPLLNRQIIYTAITRTEGSTFIFADYATLETARKTVIQRDTRILFKA